MPILYDPRNAMVHMVNGMALTEAGIHDSSQCVVVSFVALRQAALCHCLMAMLEQAKSGVHTCCVWPRLYFRWVVEDTNMRTAVNAGSAGPFAGKKARKAIGHAEWVGQRCEEPPMVCGH